MVFQSYLSDMSLLHRVYYRICAVVPITLLDTKHGLSKYRTL